MSTNVTITHALDAVADAIETSARAMRNNVTITHQPIIAHGVNAGRFRPITDLMLDRATALKQAIVELKRRGFTVIGGDLNGARPSALVRFDERCQQMLLSGEAAYNVVMQHKRQGQFLVLECHAVWVESEAH